MRVLIVESGKKPRAEDINHALESMQAVVGGLIQAIYPFADSNVALIANEEGKLLGLPLNRALRDPDSGELYDIISGTFFICAAPSDSEDFESLSEEQVRTYTKLFRMPEQFLSINGHLMVLPCPEEGNRHA